MVWGMGGEGGPDLGESLLESLGSKKGKTSGFVPAGRGGAFGAAGAGLGGNF